MSPSPLPRPGPVRARPALRAPSGARGGRVQDLLAGAVGAAGAWLIEPAAPASEQVRVAPARPRPVIAVFGLARGCGVTVTARALAVELARRDPHGAAAVHCEARAAGIPLATPAAGRLARALSQLPGIDTRAVGRLCLVGGGEPTAVSHATRELAPLVLDAGSAVLGGALAALADRVLLVARPSIEPALGAVGADCLARLGHAPLLVLNRAEPSAGATGADGSGADGSDASESDGPDGSDGPGGSDASRRAAWLRLGVHLMPESRMGAQLAAGGREARGELGRAVAELADLCVLPDYERPPAGEGS
jgi:hypothetical protein